MAKILFDMPNVLWRSLLAGRDKEFGKEYLSDDGVSTWVNGWQYGFENALTLMHSALTRWSLVPRDVVMVFEGMTPTLIKRSKAPGVDYKGSRSKRPVEAYKEFQQCRDEVEKFFLELGSTSVVQDKVEADDVLAYLADGIEEEVYVYSHDGDLARLVGTNRKGQTVHVGHNDALDINPFGPFPAKYITIYKALVGDTGDKIPGATGFGDKKFLELLGKYGLEGLDQIEGLIHTREIYLLQEDVEDCKPLKKLIESEQQVYNSYALASLYPSDIDTIFMPLVWKHGMVRDCRTDEDTRFLKWYGTRTLVHQKNYAKVLNQVRQMEYAYVALDLETDTTEESEDWMEKRKRRDADERGVDVFGSKIVSCGLTFGTNNQHTLYLTHRHAPEDGVEQLTIEQLWTLAKTVIGDRPMLAHNAQGFEIPVLAKQFGLKDLPQNILCTKILANYVDENRASGLKPSALHYLNYTQQTFAEVTTLEGFVLELPPGGRLLELSLEDGESWAKRQYKMGELTASHVFSYGTDDPIVTAALFNGFKLRTQLEDTWQTYLEVEPAPMYWQAIGYNTGVRLDLEKMNQMAAEDAKVKKVSWEILREYLISQGWEGTIPPVYTKDMTAAEIKAAYEIVTGIELKTQTRTVSKFPALIASLEHHPLDATFAELLNTALSGQPEYFTQFVQQHFSGEPILNLGSPPQKQHLMYEVMGLPIRVRNKVTKTARAKGVREGSAKTDELAIEQALHYDAIDELKPVLKAMLSMKTIETRESLFYTPYAYVLNPEDNRAHPSFNQTSTTTRRWSCSGPNFQQMPKNTDGGRFRQIVLPHHKNAVIISADFSGQELRLAADYSQDANMLSCYTGDNLRDIHSLTAIGATLRMWGRDVGYDEFQMMLKSDDPALYSAAKQLRGSAKTVNFAEQYGAMALRVSFTLMVTEEEAQMFIDGKKAMFPGVETWKRSVIAESQEKGYVCSKLGGRRHLREALTSDDYMVKSKAERQGPNFKIQGSGAEMTKLAIKRMWEAKLHERFDFVPIGPVHDEVVGSVAIKDLIPLLKEFHACMVVPFADMTVPMVSSLSFGPNFGEQYEVGESVDVGVIQKILAEKFGVKEEIAA